MPSQRRHPGRRTAWSLACAATISRWTPASTSFASARVRPKSAMSTRPSGRLISTTSAHDPSPSAPISSSLKTQATYPPSVRERARNTRPPSHPQSRDGSVTEDDAGGLEVALCHSDDVGSSEAPHPAQFEADRFAFGSGLNSGHEWRLACRTAAPLAAVPLAAEIGIIDLDPPREALAGITLHHHLHQLVLDLPGRGLGDAEPAAQFEAGDAALALGEVVDRAKPGAQRQLAGGEDGPGSQRGLPPAGGARVERAGLQPAVLAPAANRADEAARPTPAKHRIAAALFGSVQSIRPALTEALLELHLVARHR